MKESEKYGSLLYIPKKQLHEMTINDLLDHCKICKSLDKMTYSKIKKMEKLSEETLNKKKKKFLKRHINYTKKLQRKIARIGRMRRRKTKKKRVQIKL